MQARVEEAIGCSMQHSRVALVCANKPSRFWPDATLDITCKRNALWAKRHEHGQLSTANDHMQPDFAGLYKTVAIPCGSHVTGYLPREHPLVKNGSFGNRFVEGTYLRANNETSLYPYVLHRFKIRASCPRLQVLPGGIPIPRSLVPLAMHISHYQRFGTHAC